MGLKFLRTATPQAANMFAWLAVIVVAVFLASTGPARADVDPCSFKPAPAPDYRMKDGMYKAPDRFTPDQRLIV